MLSAGCDGNRLQDSSQAGILRFLLYVNLQHSPSSASLVLAVAVCTVVSAVTYGYCWEWLLLRRDCAKTLRRIRTLYDGWLGSTDGAAYSVSGRRRGHGRPAHLARCLGQRRHVGPLHAATHRRQGGTRRRRPPPARPRRSQRSHHQGKTW